jgi:hypothetical protein
MGKLVVTGETAVFVTASTLANAQAPSANGRERLSAADWARSPMRGSIPWGLHCRLA